jgi:hypothetical protein
MFEWLIDTLYMVQKRQNARRIKKLIQEVNRAEQRLIEHMFNATKK